VQQGSQVDHCLDRETLKDCLHGGLVGDVRPHLVLRQRSPFLKSKLTTSLPISTSLLQTAGPACRSLP